VLRASMLTDTYRPPLTANLPRVGRDLMIFVNGHGGARSMAGWFLGLGCGRRVKRSAAAGQVKNGSG